MITRTAGPARRASATRMAIAILAVGVAALGPAVPAAGATSGIDASHVASLTIHKLEQPADPDGLPRGDGSLIDPAPDLAPIPDVQFTLQRVAGIDLSSPGGWAETFALAGAFNRLVPEDSIRKAGYGLVPVGSLWTGADGTGVFDDLALGVYLVSETADPDGVRPLPPFLVTLPVTDPVLPNEWLYDVHVYPKSVVVDVDLHGDIFATKRAADNRPHVVGEKMDWIIEGQILDGGDVLWWRIIDHLDSRLGYVASKARFVPSGVPLIEGEDYEIIQDDATNTVTFEVTGPPTTRGLAKVTEHAAEAIEITLTTELLDAATISNTALVSTSIWDDPVGVTAKVDASTNNADVLVKEAELPPLVAWTGFEGLPYLFLGAGLVTGGFFLILAARRRRKWNEVTT